MLKTPPLTMEIKKTMRFKTINLNLLFDIKLLKFT